MPGPMLLRLTDPNDPLFRDEEDLHDAPRPRCATPLPLEAAEAAHGLESAVSTPSTIAEDSMP